jgi:hypothetical protein
MAEINTLKYLRELIKITKKDASVDVLEPNVPQMKYYETIKELHSKGKPIRIIILKARQMGFSTMTEAIMFKLTATQKNIRTGIIAHEDKATDNLFNMSKSFYDRLPDEWKPEIRASNAKELVFNNKDGTGLNSRFSVMTASGEAQGASATYQNLHISEFALWKGNKNLILGTLLQTVPNLPNTMVVIESTARGFNEFKDMWDAAVSGQNDYTPLFFAWWEMPDYKMPYSGFELMPEEEELKDRFGLKNEQLEWRRWCIRNNCNNDINIFHQEYPSYPEEAFVATGTCAFDSDAVINRLKNIPKPIEVGDFKYRIEYSKDGRKIDVKNVEFSEYKLGPIKIYEKPVPGHPYVIGGDPAGEGSDFSVLQVIDNINGRQVAVFRKQRIDPDKFAEAAYCLGQYYNWALIGIETNFTPYVHKQLEKMQYPYVFVRQIEDNFSKAVTSAFGFRMTSLTRPVIIDELKRIVRDHTSVFNDYLTLNEMLTFVMNERGSKEEALPGKHDDLVIALAIAYYIRSQQRTYVEIKPEARLKMGFDPLSTDDVDTEGEFIQW